MPKISNRKNNNPMSFVPDDDLRAIIVKMAHEYDRSYNYIVNKLLRQQLKLD